MKKTILIISVFLIFIMLFSLSGCCIIPIYTRYDDIDTENVSSVQIYDLRNWDGSSNNFLETETPVYTLEEDQLDSFWKDLGDIVFEDTIIIVLAAIDPSFDYDDWVVRINYIDDGYELISCGGYNETYNSSDEIIDFNHYSCDDLEWENFVKKYLPDEIINN